MNENISSQLRQPRYYHHTNRSSAGGFSQNPPSVCDELQAEYEREWYELARHDENGLSVILIQRMADDQSVSSANRPPRPSTSRTDRNTHYKILVYKDYQQRGIARVGDVSLSVAACHRLLKLNP